MATNKKHNGHTLGRAGSAEYVDPSSVLIEEGANPRHFDPTDDTHEIKALADDLVKGAHVYRGSLVTGQQNAATCTRTPAGDLLLVAGHRRLAAVNMINEGADVPAAEGGYAEDFRAWRTDGYDNPFPLKISIVDIDDADARFESRIAENALRRANGPMDWSKIVMHYRARGHSDAEIAEILQPYSPTGKDTVSPSWVAQMRAIADAPRSLARLLHRQEIAVSVAIALLKQARRGPDGDVDDPEITAEEAEEWIDGEIAECRDEEGEFDRKAMQKRLTGTRAVAGVKTTRTVSVLKNTLRASVGACGSRVASAILGYMEGIVTEEDFCALLAESADPSAVAEKAPAKKKAAKKAPKKTAKKKAAKKAPKKAPKKTAKKKGAAKAVEIDDSPAEEEIDLGEEEIDLGEEEIEEIEIDDEEGESEIDY